MSNQADIQLYISFMSEEDPSLRAEAQQALHDYGDRALLDLAAELTVLRQGANAPVVDAVLQTMERIGTKRAIELITFLAGSSAAEGLWPPDVCQRAQTALANMGQAVPASDTPLSDMVIRTLLFLLGSDGSGNVFVADSENHRIQVFGQVPVASSRTSWGRLKSLYR